MNELPKDELVKQEILASALGLFQRYGLAKTTMEDIAEAAGKGKSTLYYYYKSKEEIYGAVIKKQIESILAEVAAAVENSLTAADKLRTYFSSYVSSANFKYNTVLTDVLRSELKDNKKSTFSEEKKLIDENEILFVKKILLLGTNTGEFRKLTDEELDALSTVLVISFRSLMMEMIFDHDYKADKAISVLLDTLIKGLQAK